MHSFRLKTSSVSSRPINCDNNECKSMLDAKEKARLFWHCRRGMLELDLILQRFMESGFNHLTKEEINAFDALLSCTDPELFSWLMGHEHPQDPELSAIVTIIRNNS